MLLSGELISIFAIGLTKVSILLFYRRINVSQKVKKFLQVTAGVVIGGDIVFVSSDPNALYQSFASPSVKN
jgi:hypothetical protein